MDKLNKEQRKKNMQAVKAKGLEIEKILTKLLWEKGYRYRKNDKTVYGKPDITFKGLKIAIFCDSEFWHGKDWEEKRLEDFYLGVTLSGRAFRSNLFARSSQKEFPLKSLTPKAT